MRREIEIKREIKKKEKDVEKLENRRSKFIK
jgi:hypothetical protein